MDTTPKRTYRIVAVDCDGTLCSNEFPAIGIPNENVLNYIRNCKSSGDKVILFTCRNGEDLKIAVEWCREQGIEFDAVNEDIPDIKNSAFGRNKSIKPYFDVLIDDKVMNVNDVASQEGYPLTREDLIGTIIQ